MVFATHGLMAGEFEGLAEPRLVLTPPSKGSETDDGMLTASEIGRSEALRRAMLAVMRDSDRPYFAHPMFWAPFVVAGEGGRSIR